VLAAPAPVPRGQFGAALSLAGATLAVGAPGEGAAYVFEREGESWRPAARIAGAVEERFGLAVATDGERLAVGAPGPGGTGEVPGEVPADPHAAIGARPGLPGRVHVYERSPGAWPERQVVVPADSRAGDRFGQALALAGDTLAVGAPGRDGVYTFARDPQPQRWRQEALLEAAGSRAGDQLGTAVALAGDHLAAGAPFADRGGGNAGAVYVAARREDGGWGALVPLPADAGAGARLGSALALDADRLAAGAPFAGGSEGPGAVQLFSFVGGDDGWIALPPLPGRQALDLFGFAVAVAGGRLVAGVPLADLAGGSSGDAAAFDCNFEEGCTPEPILDFDDFDDFDASPAPEPRRRR